MVGYGRHLTDAGLRVGRHECVWDITTDGSCHLPVAARRRLALDQCPDRDRCIRGHVRGGFFWCEHDQQEVSDCRWGGGCGRRGFVAGVHQNAHVLRTGDTVDTGTAASRWRCERVGALRHARCQQPQYPALEVHDRLSSHHDCCGLRRRCPVVDPTTTTCSPASAARRTTSSTPRRLPVSRRRLAGGISYLAPLSAWSATENEVF
jgi:hypothetical protein